MDRDAKRLHICLGTQCNNNCVFCMEEDRESRERRLGVIDTQTAMAIMSNADCRDELMFTAGEPTLRKDLRKLVRHARSLGYAQIGIITNARLLAYEQYARDLVDAGINYILVSIHGYTAKLHDGLTRTPGSFEQATRGMRNVQDIKARMPQLKFVTTTVINRRNLAVLADHIRFLRRFAPDQIVFNCIQPVGRGERFFSQLVPSYTDVVRGFANALAQLGEVPDNLYLLDSPRCVTLSLPEKVVGFVERHRHFEPEGEILDGLDGGVAVHAGKGEGMLKLVTKEGLDQVLRTKGPRCRQCALDTVCEGIWKKYVDEYGLEEFVPVDPVRELPNE